MPPARPLCRGAPERSQKPDYFDIAPICPRRNLATPDWPFTWVRRALGELLVHSQRNRIGTQAGESAVAVALRVFDAPPHARRGLQAGEPASLARQSFPAETAAQLSRWHVSGTAYQSLAGEPRKAVVGRLLVHDAFEALPFALRGVR